MRKLIFNSLTCSALLLPVLFLTACGGSNGGIPETLAVEVTDKNFSGPYAEYIEIDDNNLEIKFEKIESRYKKDPAYKVTIPVTIKVVGENKDLDLYEIPIDFLDENGVVIKTIMIDSWGAGSEPVKKIRKDIKNGIIGNSYKVELTEELESDEARKFVQEVKTAKGGLLEGNIEEPEEQKKSSSGGLYVADADFSGSFGDILKIKDGTYYLKIDDSIFQGEKSIKIKVNIEILEQSSSELDRIYLNLVNESGTTLYSISEDIPTAFQEMIKKGDIGKSYLMEFSALIDDEEADLVKNEAVAISGGATRTK